MSRSGLVLFAVLLAVTLPLAAWMAAPLAQEAPSVPQDPTPANAALFAALAVVFVALATGMAFLLLYLVRTGRTRWLRPFFLGAVAVVLSIAFARPVTWLAPWIGGDAAWLLALLASIALVVAWARSSAAWLQAVMAVLVSAAIASFLGVLLGLAALLVLLVALAGYDLWAVRRTGHMLRLADAARDLRLPLMIEHGGDRPVAFRSVARPPGEAVPTQEADGPPTPSQQDGSSTPWQSPPDTHKPPHKRPNRRSGGSFMMGLGDLAFPAAWFVAVVQAAAQHDWGVLPSAGAWVGTLAGYGGLALALQRRAAQPGIPFLAGGAMVGAAFGLWLATGSLRFW